MIGQGFSSEISSNRTMSSNSDDHRTSPSISTNHSNSTDISLGKKVIISHQTLSRLDQCRFFQALTLEEKQRMMRENDQNFSTKTQEEILPERSMPLMSMTPTSSTNTSSAFYKDLTSSLFHVMSTSQTMPSLIRPTIVHSIKPTSNFPVTSSHAMDLTASLINNINSLAPRPQVPVQRPNVSTSKTAAAELDDLLN